MPLPKIDELFALLKGAKFLTAEACTLGISADLSPLVGHVK